eukprot:255076-Chlamydomonas_euryale.AAC.1
MEERRGRGRLRNAVQRMTASVAPRQLTTRPHPPFLPSPIHLQQLPVREEELLSHYSGAQRRRARKPRGARDARSGRGRSHHGCVGAAAPHRRRHRARPRDVHLEPAKQSLRVGRRGRVAARHLRHQRAQHARRVHGVRGARQPAARRRWWPPPQERAAWRDDASGVGGGARGRFPHVHPFCVECERVGVH